MKVSSKLKPSEFEEKWQQEWEKRGVYQPDMKSAKKPYYNLMMFPYPSAEGLHVGNMYAFTGADINGRYKRMKGFDVFEPIGLDGFGIHSENYAIKIGKHPAQQAKISQKNFYRQLRASGNGFAWRNTLETYDPAYYKWTQWIFTQMFKRGLAYRKKSPVNFCPSCKTVLSDEQVIDGSCERCKSLVEKREMEQWYFKITNYANRLLGNLDKLAWANKVKIGQRNWIGKSEGAMLKFKVKDMDIYFEMFDSVPQTFMAQTFTVIAPEHQAVYDLVKGTEYEKPVMEFVGKIKKKKAAQKFDIEKETEGIFTGRYIEYTPSKKLLPIWVASFVIADYGTGVVNCSVHDQRDFIFAKKYGLPLHPVMFPDDPKEAEKIRKLEYCYHHAPEGILTEPVVFKGRRWEEVREDILSYIEKNGWGKRTAQYHLRDWCISRQRYWGAPIPMIECPDCGWVPVPEKDLPVLLPADVADWKPEGTGKGPLAKIESFVNTKCPECGRPARRETDVCDTFLDSSWYHMRYPSIGLSSISNFSDTQHLSKADSIRGAINTAFPKQSSSGRGRSSKLISSDNLPPTTNDQLPWDPEITKKWLPVTQYIGGAEHTVLHLLYARFVAMVFKDLGMIGFEEPYTRFYAHGLIIAEGAKMSKSRGNVIVPDEYIRKYGADTLRTYLMFLGPFSHGGDFRDTGIAGMYRFLSRIWRLAQEAQNSNVKTQILDNSLLRVMHKTVKEVTEDMENFRYNTAIAHIMEYVNALTENKEQMAKNNIEVLLLLLAPFAPHMTEELWQYLTHDPQPTCLAGRRATHNYKSIHHQPWPSYDPAMLVEDAVTIVVQVNGKVRDIISVKREAGSVKEDVEAEAKKSDKVQKYIAGKIIRKAIFVPGKLLNFVV
ncbi:leucine--tRNA ligase [Patescibacteria group bacterium]|nr:leucine--tRNA ligase [Patescibacteria group bacterium]